MSERDNRLTRIEDTLSKVLDLLLKTQHRADRAGNLASKRRNLKRNFKPEELPDALKSQTVRIQNNVMRYRDQLIKLTKEGQHVGAIARETGLNRGTVRLYMGYLEITPNKALPQNILGARQYPKVPSLRIQNEYLKQNPWETSEEEAS